MYSSYCNKINNTDLKELFLIYFFFSVRPATVVALVQIVSSVMFWRVSANAKLNLEDKTVPDVH